MADDEYDETSGLLPKRRSEPNMRMFRNRANVYIESWEETATLLTPVERHNTCLLAIREEFRCRNLRLRWPTPLVFVRPQWRWPLFVFMSYRILATCYVTGWLIYSTIHSKVINGFIWPIYLTNWGFTALCLHLWTSTMLTVSHAITHRHFFCEAPPLHRSMGTPVSATDSEIDFQEDGQDDVGFVMPTDRLPWYCKLSWVLFNIIANGAIIISVVFFVGLYPQIYNNGQFPTPEDFNFHAVNSIIILLELMFSALPIRILHFVFVEMFGIAYIAMSLLLYYFYTERPIYPKILDWNHPLSTGLIVAGLIFIAAPLLQIILFSLYKLRVLVFRKLYDFD